MLAKVAYKDTSKKCMKLKDNPDELLKTHLAATAKSFPLVARWRLRFPLLLPLLGGMWRWWLGPCLHQEETQVCKPNQQEPGCLRISQTRTWLKLSNLREKLPRGGSCCNWGFAITHRWIHPNWEWAWWVGLGSQFFMPSLWQNYP